MSTSAPPSPRGQIPRKHSIRYKASRNSQTSNEQDKNQMKTSPKGQNRILKAMQDILASCGFDGNGWKNNFILAAED